MVLEHLSRLRDATRRRASSYDRSGGNRDFVEVAPGAAHRIRLRGPGVVRHVWMTALGQDPHLLRTCSLRVWWDGAGEPSVDAPLGDFFGLGFGDCANFASLPLQRTPQNGRGMSCYFPMPFRDEARIELWNESAQPISNLFYYVDWEEVPALPADEAYFHAWFRRENPTDGVDDRGMSNREYQCEGLNPTGEGNYLVLDVTGRGHYVGTVLSIHNLRRTELSNWYGEGDDMWWIDGAEVPSLHGTGTEDYFDTAWGPNQYHAGPYSGLTMPGGVNWSGRVCMYRFHIEDPVHFRQHLRLSIEHGHANHRSDDWSSVAYWYAAEPRSPDMPRVPVEARIPWPADHCPGLPSIEASDCG